jgi:hypothetical protein
MFYLAGPPNHPRGRLESKSLISYPPLAGVPSVIGLATAARREPGLPGPGPLRRPAPPCALRHPWPACLTHTSHRPGWPAQLAPVKQAASSGAKGGQGAGRWLHGQALSYASRGLSCRPCAASRSQSERSRFLALFAPP